MELLNELLRDKMQRKKLSIRNTALECGVSYMTIGRALDRLPLTLESLLAICKWLEVSPSLILDAQIPNKSQIGAKIAAAMETYPDLGQAFADALDGFDQNVEYIDVIKDLVAYATYRIKASSSNQVAPKDGPASDKLKPH